MLTVGNDGQFARCVEVLRCPALATDERFSTNATRVRNRDELIATLRAVFLHKDTKTWLSALSAVGVPCGPVNNIQQALESDYAREQELVKSMSHPLHDALPTVANPVRFSETPVQYEQAPPLLGQHTDEVLADWLGYSEASIAKLRDTGAIQSIDDV